MVNKATKVMAGVLILLGCVSAASAQDGVIRGRIGVSNNDFTTLWSGGDLKTKYNSLNAGATYIMSSGWYVDGAVKTSMKGTWNTVELSSINDGYDNDYKRRDLTLTLGKALDGGWQLFGGYQKVNSTIQLPNAAAASPWSAANLNEEFNVAGYFAGVGKTISLPVGSLNLNAAVGKMKGKVLNSQGYWFESDTGTGNSIGATYSYPLADKTTLSFEYKTQKYKYENFTSPTSGAIMNLTSGNDKMRMLGVSVSHQF